MTIRTFTASDDAALHVADFLTREGVRATFKVVGEKARTLEILSALRRARPELNVMPSFVSPPVYSITLYTPGANTPGAVMLRLPASTRLPASAPPPCVSARRK